MVNFWKTTESRGWEEKVFFLFWLGSPELSVRQRHSANGFGRAVVAVIHEFYKIQVFGKLKKLIRSKQTLLTFF